LWPVALGLTAIGAAAVMLMVAMTRAETVTSAPVDRSGTASKPPASPPASVRAEQSTADNVKHAWNATRPRQDLRYGRDVIIFELDADETVSVWRKQVRPQLAVRCTDGVMDMYVMTRSAAAVEDSTNQHTVQISLDGGEAAAEKWEHSVDHEALFAPDGSPLIGQIAAARTMTFTFTPFNATPAVVHFNVAGLGAHLKKAAKTCGTTRSS
jgi:Type VI secretion system VasI, EvfG, VC_A0118